jgi:transcriptional regulator with XRE-family HTH domain
MVRFERPLGTLARTLRALRAEQGIDQLALAIAMGVGDAGYLSRLENGRRSNPSHEYLRRYVLAYERLGRPLNEAQLARLANAVLRAAPAA